MTPALLNGRTLARWNPPSPGSQATVYCCPNAGGGAASIRPLAVNAPETLDVVGVRLPGREKRFAEEPLTDFTASVADIAAAVRDDPYRDGGPVVMLGHCFGAVLAFEVAHALAAAGGTELLGVALVSPPGPADTMRVPSADLPQETFVEQLAALGGIPPEVRDNPEILELVLPSMRADVASVGAFRMPDHEPLAAPVTVIRGAADRHCPPATVGQWLPLGRGGRLRSVPAGHFVLSEQPVAVLQEVQDLVVRGAAAR